LRKSLSKLLDILVGF